MRQARRSSFPRSAWECTSAAPRPRTLFDRTPGIGRSSDAERPGRPFPRGAWERGAWRGLRSCLLLLVFLILARPVFAQRVVTFPPAEAPPPPPAKAPPKTVAGGEETDIIPDP